MPSFEDKWFFLGHVRPSEQEELQSLLKKYNVRGRDEFPYSDPTAIYVDNAFRIDSIRKRLWGHRWATDKDWLANNPHEKDFDPRKVIKKK